MAAERVGKSRLEIMVVRGAQMAPDDPGRNDAQGAIGRRGGEMIDTLGMTAADPLTGGDIRVAGTIPPLSRAGHAKGPRQPAMPATPLPATPLTISGAKSITSSDPQSAARRALVVVKSCSQRPVLPFPLRSIGDGWPWPTVRSFSLPPLRS
jgi:hypothetical protein